MMMRMMKRLRILVHLVSELLLVFQRHLRNESPSLVSTEKFEDLMIKFRDSKDYESYLVWWVDTGMLLLSSMTSNWSTWWSVVGSTTTSSLVVAWVSTSISSSISLSTISSSWSEWSNTSSITTGSSSSKGTSSSESTGSSITSTS